MLTSGSLCSSPAGPVSSSCRGIPSNSHLDSFLIWIKSCFENFKIKLNFKDKSNSGQSGSCDCLLHHHILTLLLQVLTITIIAIITVTIINIIITMTVWVITPSILTEKRQPLSPLFQISSNCPSYNSLSLFNSIEYHSRAVQIVGPFVIMIYRMIAKDLLRFFVIYLIFIMGFSQAYYIIFQTYDGELDRFHTRWSSDIYFPDKQCQANPSLSGVCVQFMPHNAPFESFFRVDHPHSSSSNMIFGNLHQMFDMSLGHFIKLYKLLPFCWTPLHIIGKVISYI